MVVMLLLVRMQNYRFHFSYAKLSLIFFRVYEDTMKSMVRFLVCLHGHGNYKSKYNFMENDIILLLYNKLINLLGVSTKL